MRPMRVRGLLLDLDGILYLGGFKEAGSGRGNGLRAGESHIILDSVAGVPEAIGQPEGEG